MKKLNFIAGLLIILVSGLASYTNASVIGNVQVKKSTELESTYTSNLVGVSLNSKVDFRVLISTSTIGNFGGNVSLPSGFSLFGTVNIGSKNTCTTNINSSGNNGISYSFTNGGGTCKVEMLGTYTVNTLGTKTITSTYNDGSTIYPFDNIYVGVTNYITANASNTLDYDRDGYIDGMKVIFDNNITIGNIDISKFNISYLGLNASNLAISGVVNNELYLRYDDGTWDGSIIPDLEINSYTTDGGNITFSQINTSSIVESDGASPVIRQINSVTILNNLGIIQNNIVDSYSSGTITLDFSEPINTSTINGLKFSYNGTDSLTGNYSFLNSNKRVVFLPTNNFTGDIRVITNNNLRDNSSSSNFVRNIDYLVDIIDNVAPIGISIYGTNGISVNSGTIETESKFVELNISASDGFALSGMMISNLNNFSDANWIGYNDTITNWNLLTNSSGTGTKYVYIKFIDTNNNISHVYSDSITYNPQLDFIDLNFQSPVFTNNNSIILSGGCSYDSGASSLIIEYRYNLGTWTQGPTCNNLTKSWSWEFDNYNSNSLNNVSLRFKDYTGTTKEFELVHDNSNPSGILTINNNEEYTNDPNNYLQLLLTGTDNFGIYTFELSGDLEDIYLGRFLYTDSNIIVQGEPGEGTKTVSVKYYDRAGNESPSYIKFIKIDKSNPIGTIEIEGGNEFSNDYDVEISLTYDDNYEIGNIMVSEDVNFTGGIWISPQGTMNFTLSNGNGTKTLYYKVKDIAGNVSSVYQDSIIIDTQDPQTSINQGSGTFENNTNIDITLTCVDNGLSGCKNSFYRIGTSGIFNTYTGTINISGSNVTKKLFYYSEDNAGNIESINEVTYTFDESYININSVVANHTNNNSIILTGECNNVSGSQLIEYNINNTIRTGGVQCNGNTRTSNLLLIENVTNNITFRFVDNITVSNTTSITHDSTSPNNVDLIIGNNSGYTKNTSIILNITGFDINGIHSMSISGDIISNILTGYVENLNINLTSGEGNKIIYVTLYDEAGNHSITVNKSIILDQTLPTVSISPNGGLFTTTQQVTISMNKSGTIYYSFNGLIDLTTEGLIYTGNTTLNSSTIVYYQGKDLAGNISAKQSANFNKYTDQNSGGLGGGGGGGGGSIYQPIFVPKPTKDPTITGEDGKDYFDFEALKNQVYQVGNSSQIELFDKLFPKLLELLGDVNELPYIGTSLDNKRINYFNYIKGFFINIFNYKNTGELSYKERAKSYLNKLLKQESEIRNSYEGLFYIENGFLFPKSTKYNKTFLLIQKALFKKYNGLLIKNIITNDEFTHLKKVYNNFVYSLIMYKLDKNNNLKEFTKLQLKIILKYYEMK